MLATGYKDKQGNNEVNIRGGYVQGLKSFIIWKGKL
jgi:hypothetical protein